MICKLPGKYVSQEKTLRIDVKFLYPSKKTEYPPTRAAVGVFDETQGNYSVHVIKLSSIRGSTGLIYRVFRTKNKKEALTQQQKVKDLLESGKNVIITDLGEATIESLEEKVDCK